MSAQTQQLEDLASRAAAARDAGDLPRAIDLYRQGTQLKSDWAEGWWYLGLLQYSGNQYPRAIDAFNHLIGLQPHAAPAIALRGLCEFETAAYEDALRDLELSVAHGAANEPQNEQILRIHLAELLTQAGRFDDALAQYEILAAKQLRDADVPIGLALAGMHIASLPKDVPAENRDQFEAAGVAGYAFLSGDTETSDGLFDQLFARYPTAPNLHFYYGFLSFKRFLELAATQFQAEVAVNPTNLQARTLLAFSLILIGRYREALPEAERVFSEAPDMEMAQLTLARCLAETGNVQRATELFNRVLQHDPDNLEAHIGLAAIYSRQGKREDAYRERITCLGLAK